MTQSKHSDSPPLAQSGPHKFSSIRWWDALSAGGRCKHCFLPRHAHPVHRWVRARPWGDHRRADVSWALMSTRRKKEPWMSDRVCAWCGHAWTERGFDHHGCAEALKEEAEGLL